MQFNSEHKVVFKYFYGNLNENAACVHVASVQPIDIQYSCGLGHISIPFFQRLTFDVNQ